MAEEMFEREFRQKLGDLYMGEGRCRVESEVILPDYKEEAQRIIRMDTCARVNSKNIYLKGQDIVFEIDGVVSFNILYKTDRGGEKGGTSAFLTRENFSHTFKIPHHGEEIDPSEIASFVEVNSEGSIAKLQGPRKISARCDISISLDLKCNRSIALIEKSGAEDIKTQEKEVRIARLASFFTEEMNFSETISLPKAYLSIEELCEMDVNLYAQNVQAEDGGVRFTGLCDLHCSYTAKGEDLFVSFYQPIEFEKRIGIPGVEEGQFCKVNMTPNFLKASTDINEEGENKNILFEISVTCEVTSFENQKCMIVEDAFSTKTDLLLKREKESAEEILAMKDFSVSVRENIPLKDKGLFRAEGIRSAVDFKDCYLEEGKIVLEGKLFYRYLGNFDSGEMENFEDSLEFKCDFPADGVHIPSEKECRIEVFGTSRSLDMDPDGEQIRLRFDLAGCITVYCKHHINPVTGAERGEKFSDLSGRILYVYPSGDENLWELAKKYHTSPEKLREENSLEEDELPPFLRITR